MMDPFTINQMGRIRQAELLQEAAGYPERTPVRLFSVSRWLKSVFQWVRLPRLPMPNRRRVSRS